MKFAVCFLAFSLIAACANAGPVPSGNGPRGMKTANGTIVNPPGSTVLRSRLDTAKVRAQYLDGEFQSAIDILEAELKENDRISHSDSVFIFKHLGVMYAADYEQRERGKMFMYKLLTTEPTAKIMDMYASDMIYMIFKNIQDEFETKRVRLGRQNTDRVLTDSNSKSSPALSDSKQVEKQSKGRTLIWIGATGAVVAAGVVGYFTWDHSGKTVTRLHYPE